jgi:5-methylthioadenosine/S-adenosylhomocysteine deaminase
VTAEDALAMATCEAARLIGLDGEVGSLEPGKRADIAVFDLENPASGIWHDPVAALVGSGGRLRDVYVDGQQLVRDGAFVRVSAKGVAACIDEARERAHALLARADVPAATTGLAERAALDAIV